MKTLLPFFALVLAAGFPVVGFAEMAGVSLPAFLTGEIVLGIFVSILATLIFLSDYARSFRSFLATRPASHFTAVVDARRRRSPGMSNRAKVSRLPR